METILLSLKAKQSISFFQLIKKIKNKMEFAAYFLALLELMSFQKIRIIQQENHGEIFIYSRQKAERYG